MQMVLSCIMCLLMGNLVSAQSLNIEWDTVYIMPVDGQIVNGYVTLSNQTSDSIDVEWEVIENTINPNWFIQFCDFAECATNEFEPIPNSRRGDLEPGYDDSWYVGINPNGYPIEGGVWTIVIHNHTAQTTDTVTWLIDNQTSSNELKEKVSYKISLYPNPASNLINIKNPDARHLNFRILDVAGKELKNGRVTRDHEPITIDALPAGMYFVAVTDENSDNRQLLKFIKQ